MHSVSDARSIFQQSDDSERQRVSRQKPNIEIVPGRQSMAL